MKKDFANRKYSIRFHEMQYISLIGGVILGFIALKVTGIEGAISIWFSTAIFTTVLYWMMIIIHYIENIDAMLKKITDTPEEER